MIGPKSGPISCAAFFPAMIGPKSGPISVSPHENYVTSSDATGTEEGNEIKRLVPKIRRGLEVAAALAQLPGAETLTERSQSIDIDTRRGLTHG